MELCLKHIYDSDILIVEDIPTAMREMDQSGYRQLVLTAIHYLVERAETKHSHVFFEHLNTVLTEETRTEVMTIRQQLEQQAEQRGIQIGEQRGMEIGEQRGWKNAVQEIVLKLKKKGLNKVDIAQLTDVDPSQVEEWLQEEAEPLD